MTECSTDTDHPIHGHTQSDAGHLLHHHTPQESAGKAVLRPVWGAHCTHTQSPNQCTYLLLFAVYQ